MDKLSRNLEYETSDISDNVKSLMLDLQNRMSATMDLSYRNKKDFEKQTEF